MRKAIRHGRRRGDGGAFPLNKGGGAERQPSRSDGGRGAQGGCPVFRESNTTPWRAARSFAFSPPLIRGTPLKLPSVGGVAAGQTGWVSHQPMTHPSAGGACPSQEGNIFVKCGAARRHEISERPPLDLPLKHFARETAVVPTQCRRRAKSAGPALQAGGPELCLGSISYPGENRGTVSFVNAVRVIFS